jgi:predicted ATPase
VSNNLPVERTVLLGRDAEIGEIAEMLAQHRLVTLLGMGGTGKTRLASAVAAEVAHEFADGAWFVDLVPASGADVAEAIATAMGLQLAGTDLIASLANLLADRELLVVLDNCEHITDDVADVVDVLLERTTRLRLLATSREPMQLPDERQAQVPPLGVTDGLMSPAVQLFLTAAERVGVEVPPEEIANVTQICAHLDGLPLAVELAAAQLRQLGVAGLADRLDQRFELLARGRRQRGRQSSLQAVLEDTWAMLDPTEEQMLLQLAAFPADFSADDVEGVAGELSSMAPARTIAGLADLGLVAWSTDGRHRLLETVKLFARQAWAATTDPDRYVERHTRWVLGHLDAYVPQAWFTSLEILGWASSHYDDHRAVEDRLTTAGRTSELTRLLSALTFTYTYDTGTRASAAIDRIEHHLDRLELSDHERGLLNLVIASAGLPARRPDWIERGSSTAVPLLREHGTPEEVAAALIVNSWMIVFQDGEAALVLLHEARALADVASGYLATHYAVAGRTDESLQTLADLEVRLQGRPMDYGGTLYAYGTMAVRFMTEPEAARAAGQHLVREFAKAHNGGEEGRNEIYAVALAARGDVAETRSLVAEAKIRAGRQSGDDGLPDLLIPPAALAWRLGHFDAARRWLTAIRRSPKPTKSFHMTIMYRQLRTAVGLLDENPLDSATLDDIWDEAVAWMDAL